MSTGIFIIISIIGLSLLVLIITGIVSYKKMKPTIANFKDLKIDIQQKVQFYNRESQHLNTHIQELNQEAINLQQEVEVKSIHVQDFMNRKGEFQSSLNYLQDHIGEYSKGIAMNVKDEVQEEGPKMLKVFKRTFKKTVQKQRQRFKNKEESRGIL